MISYILFNTLIYGSIAFMLSSYFAYAKYINLSIGSFMVLVVYILAATTRQGRWPHQALTLVCVFIVYVLINHIILNYFKNEKQKDLLGFIFTLGAAILIENTTQIIYGSSPASLESMSIPPIRLAGILLCIQGLITYIFENSYVGKIYQGIYSNIGSIRTLGISTQKLLHVLFGLFFVATIGLAVLIAQQGSIRPSDHLFYIIKGIGIMILVGVGNRAYIYLGALLYVIVEYTLFIMRGLPLGYKEALILVVILILLLLKPQGLFSFGKRTI